MGDIKSAREVAMEKVEKLGEATDEERLRWKYVPEGEKLAAGYLKQDCNLVVELGKYEDKVRRYIIEGVGEVLIRNIDLPASDLAKRNSKRAMDGLKTLKSDKVAVENVYSKIRSLFDHYVEQGEQQRKQAYESLKAEFGAKIQQALQQQFGSSMGIEMDVEGQPQFQEEWRRLQTQIDSQYLKLLEENKQELSSIT
tara:strand:- start:767 stop:1357 length:591 start_codon:yes stop_codon:yes gene_type:complete